MDTLTTAVGSNTTLALLLALVLFLVLLRACWSNVRLRLAPNPLDNIPGPTGYGSFAFGHIDNLWNPDGWEFHRMLAEKFGPVSKINTYFGARGLYVFDPRATHNIMNKNQWAFDESQSFRDVNKVMLGEGILTSTGDRHRVHRKNLAYLFSVSHLRKMVPTFHEVVSRAETTLTRQVAEGPKEVDVLMWTTRIALELITTSGFAFSVDRLDDESQPHRYSEASRQIMPQLINIAAVTGMMIPVLIRLGPRWFRRMLVDIFAHVAPPVKTFRFVIDTMHETAVEIFKTKKAALESGELSLADGARGDQDIISALLRINLSEKEDDKLTDGELLGQMNSIAFAATDTSSSMFSRTFQMLATHKDVQTRLRQEIREAKAANGGEELDYEGLSNLKYMDAVCKETLRLFPSFSMVQRVANEDVVVPLHTPIQGINGEPVTSLPIMKGTSIYLGILASNTNTALWGPDAHEWKPERWFSPLPKEVEDANSGGVYSHMLTFIGGGRSCIGLKFAELEIKAVLSRLVDRLEFSLPKDKRITWKMTAITTPWDWENNRKNPSMPMIVSLAP